MAGINGARLRFSELFALRIWVVNLASIDDRLSEVTTPTKRCKVQIKFLFERQNEMLCRWMPLKKLECLHKS